MTDSIRRSIIAQTERRLADSYQFPINSSALDFELEPEALASLQKSNTPARGAVYLYQAPDEEELSLGFFVSHEVLNPLSEQDPFERLDANNIDAFWVLVEELSPFHLIVNRASQGRKLTLLELEWQGEIDKVLMSGKLILEQTGQPHFEQLSYHLHRSCRSVGSDPLLYERASYYAAAYWRLLMPTLRGLSSAQQVSFAQHQCQAAYHELWCEKFRRITKGAI